MKFFDRATFSTRTVTPEGFLEATAKVGRPGVQDYVKGIDFLDDDLPERLRMKPFGSTIKVLRPRNEVFNPQSMKSFEGKPITDNHPPKKVVDSSNVKQFQVGFSKKVAAAKDGDSIEAGVLIQDKGTVRSVQKGKDQISLGYEAHIDFTPGDDEEFGPYDAFQHSITGNHIAIVDHARAGMEFRLNDRQSNKGKNTMKVRVIDGKSIELSDDAADIFDSLKAKNAQLASDKDALKAQLVDAESSLETVKGERDAAKAKSFTDADVQKQVAKAVKARISLVDNASKVVDVDFAEKTDNEIRLEVIKKLGDGKVDVPSDASDEYIDAVYSTLVNTANPKKKALGDGFGQETSLTDVDKAREEMVARRGTPAN